MSNEKSVTVKESSIEVAIAVHATIKEFQRSAHPLDFQKRFAGKDHVILVAYIKDVPAGYLIAYDRDNDKSIYCWMAGVNPAYRKRGVLKALMSQLQDWARQHDYQIIKIKTRNRRREMLSYLVKYGFHFTAVLPKQELEENRILLEKKIS